MFTYSDSAPGFSLLRLTAITPAGALARYSRVMRTPSSLKLTRATPSLMSSSRR